MNLIKREIRDAIDQLRNSYLPRRDQELVRCARQFVSELYYTDNEVLDEILSVETREDLIDGIRSFLIDEDGKVSVYGVSEAALNQFAEDAADAIIEALEDASFRAE